MIKTEYNETLEVKNGYLVWTNHNNLDDITSMIPKERFPELIKMLQESE